MKSPGSTWELHSKLAGLSLVEGGRIPGVAVKCVEIWRNTGCEGGPLDKDLRSGAKAWGANRIRYPGSPRRKRCRLGGCALEAWLPELTR